MARVVVLQAADVAEGQEAGGGEVNLQDAIVEFLVEHGASPALSVELAIDIAASWSRKIERERRDQDIADLFHEIKAAGVVERFGVHRATAYRAIHKVAEKRKLATTTV